MSDEIKKQLYVDEDWKSKAQAEKERLAEEAQKAASETKAVEQPSPAASSASKSSGPAEGAPNESAADAQREPLPPASMATLISSLATQTLLALGQFAHPDSGRAEIDLEYAKHLVDTLAVLDEKTKGNLTPPEARMLEDVLHQLRMAYVAMQQEMGQRA